jgi:cyclohexanone monooxygenase
MQGDWMVRFLEHLRERGVTRVEPTVDAGRAWTAHLAELADRTLFSRADSWYMGANIPGKRRQLLNYPATDAYLERLDQVAADGYAGFVTS